MKTDYSINYCIPLCDAMQVGFVVSKEPAALIFLVGVNFVGWLVNFTTLLAPQHCT
jgi:hypothetical protein